MVGVINHIKAPMLHLLKDQRDLLVEALKFKHSKYTGENTTNNIRIYKMYETVSSIIIMHALGGSTEHSESIIIIGSPMNV